MLASLEQAFRERVPFQEDALLGAELTTEVRPILHCLLEAASVQLESACVEAYGLLSRLGHQAGALGATPTALLVLREALSGVLNAAGIHGPGLSPEELTMVLMEGYCAGRDERTSSSLRSSIRSSQIRFRLAPRCCVVTLNGPLDVDALGAVLDDAARWCFQENALSVLLDATCLQASPSQDVARALLEFCLSCRQVGAQVVLACTDATWREALESLGLRESGALLVPGDASCAVPEALRLAGLTIRPAQRGLLSLIAGR